MTPLCDAICENHIYIVKLLLADPTCDPTENDNQALRLAVEKRRIDIVKLLMADPRVATTGDKQRLFLYTVYNEEFDIMDQLLKDPRIDPSAERNRALINATIRSKYAIVKRLLQDPRVIPTRAMLHHAIHRDNKGIIDLFLTESRIPVGDRAEELREALWENRKWLAHRLLQSLISEPAFDITMCDNLIMDKAIYYGMSDIIALCISDPRIDVHKALIDALKQNKTDIARQILASPRIDPSIHNNAAMRLADERRLYKICKVLLEDPRVAATWTGRGSAEKAKKAVERTLRMKEELFAAAWHPRRFQEWCLDSEERVEFNES